MSRKIKVIFTLSVLLNLLLGGMAVGHLSMRGQWLSQFEEGLSPQGVQTVRTAFGEGRKDFWPMMQEIKVEKDGLMQIINNPDFDEVAFDAASAKVRASVAKMTDHRFSMLKRVVRDLPQGDKAKFADKFIHMASGFGKAHGGKGHGKGDKRGDWMQKDHFKGEPKPADDSTQFPPMPEPVGQE